MLLKELNIIGFGKFKNESLILKEGINLIYGENEAGKSTLHSFIDGMFYGFLKPNVKSALYLDEHEKYNPWDKSRYAGVIHFEHEGKSYRIERNFAKGEESTKVLDETTGVDITRSIDGGVSRIIQPGIHFFGFNTRVFSNTISIKQLETKTDDKLANEVTEKLINVTTALDDNISVDKAISELKGRIAEIGTDRATTRPYARNLKYIETLDGEKRKILSEKHTYESYLEEQSRLENLLYLEEVKLRDLKDRLSKVELVEKMKILQESQILLDEIKNIEGKIVDLSRYSRLSMDKYKEGINLNNSIDFINNSIDESKTELNIIQNRLRTMDEEKNNTSTNNIEEITKDYNNYEEIENKKNEILYKKEDNMLEFIKRDYKSYEDRIVKYKTMQILFLILSFIAVVATIVLKQYLTIGSLFVLFGIVGVYFSNRIKKLKNVRNKTKIQINEIEDKENNNKVEVQKIEKLQNDLLNKYNINTKIEFKRLFDLTQIEFYRKQEYIELYKELKAKKESLENRIMDYESRRKQSDERLKGILDENNVKNLEELSEGLDKKNLYEQNCKELETKKELLVRVLGQTTVENLVAELENKDIQIVGEILDKNQLKYQIDRSNEGVSDLRIALRGIEENLSILGKDIARLVEIEEELDRKIIYKKELDQKLVSLELATQTIEELSKDIHSQFAPTINKKVSEIVNKITTGKYNNIKISESLKISVENPSTKEIIEIENLSGGTIDQLYFSLRFGIINSMVENRLPLILDDCFIQYDDIRLRNIINFLDEIGSERQVILFTCHNREKRLLDELGVNFNYIELT